MVHNHLTNTFSGCYYISSGYTGDDPDHLTGLQFEGPWDRPEASGDSRSTWTDSALGQPGTLAMWPGPLNHSVPTHTGDTERISLAFNLALTLKAQ